MNSVYDDKVLHEAIRNFMDAGRIATSAEMRLACHGLASLAFSINELQKRVHLVEEKVGVSPMRDIQELLGAAMCEEGESHIVDRGEGSVLMRSRLEEK